MSNQPSPANAPPGTEGFLDGFLPRMTANAVAMAGVAALTWWMVDDRASEQAHSLEAARAEAALLRFERDRMQALSQELAREVHDAGMEAEIAHWQLRWTEERLRRLEAEGSDGNAAPRVRAASRIEPLDAPAAAFLAEQVDALVAQADHRSEAPEPAGGSGAEPDAGVSPLGGGFEAQPFDARIPALRAASGQRDRDRALAAWKQVVEEVVVAECGGRFSQAGRWRCEDEHRRDLWPYTDAAIDCLLSGNAVPDYVADLPLVDLPSHSVPLDEGALILCDGALSNL